MRCRSSRPRRPHPVCDQPLHRVARELAGNRAMKIALTKIGHLGHDIGRTRGASTLRRCPLALDVGDAVAGGADGLAMAGGDGSQAIVASIAAELDLPYTCIPGRHAQPLRARPRRRPRRRGRRARCLRRPVSRRRALARKPGLLPSTHPSSSNPDAGPGMKRRRS
jgi:hypothetical protein